MQFVKLFLFSRRCVSCKAAQLGYIDSHRKEPCKENSFRKKDLQGVQLVKFLIAGNLFLNKQNHSLSLQLRPTTAYGKHCIDLVPAETGPHSTKVGVSINDANIWQISLVPFAWLFLLTRRSLFTCTNTFQYFHRQYSTTETLFLHV